MDLASYALVSRSFLHLARQESYRYLDFSFQGASIQRFDYHHAVVGGPDEIESRFKICELLLTLVANPHLQPYARTVHFRYQPPTIMRLHVSAIETGFPFSCAEAAKMVKAAVRRSSQLRHAFISDSHYIVPSTEFIRMLGPLETLRWGGLKLQTRMDGVSIMAMLAARPGIETLALRGAFNLFNFDPTAAPLPLDSVFIPRFTHLKTLITTDLELLHWVAASPSAKTLTDLAIPFFQGENFHHAPLHRFTALRFLEIEVGNSMYIENAFDSDKWTRLMNLLQTKPRSSASEREEPSGGCQIERLSFVETISFVDDTRYVLEFDPFIPASVKELDLSGLRFTASALAFIINQSSSLKWISYFCRSPTRSSRYPDREAQQLSQRTVRKGRKHLTELCALKKIVKGAEDTEEEDSFDADSGW